MATITTSVATIAPDLMPDPVGVPARFSSQGQVQRYPGNTTLCHLPTNSPLLPALRALHVAVSSHAILSKPIHLLPPASWHMTVLDGVREMGREPEWWPLGMENQPLVECTQEFALRLRQLGPELAKEGLAPPYRMRVRGFDTAIHGIGLEVEGATVEEEKRMRRLRDRIADAFGFRAPNHEVYQFHISVAYLLRRLDGAERKELTRVFSQNLAAIQQEFELGAVEFCTFENMYEFPRLFHLGR
jgi:hypothetical protein